MQRRWAAGILPVAVSDDGCVVVLLGRDAVDKGGKWSDFAGGGEIVDDDPRATAIREFDEETGGILHLDTSDIDRALMTFTDVTPSGKTLYRYVVHVPYDPDLPLKFTWSKNDEKTAVAWFALERLPPLRGVFARQMRRDARRIADAVLTEKRAPEHR